jgi:hypothetical protein
VEQRFDAVSLIKGRSRDHKERALQPGKPPRPRRDLEYVPIEHQGRTYVLVRDRFGLVQQGKAFSADMYRFLALLESCGSVREVQSGLMRLNQGRFFSEQEIDRLIQSLDESFLLDTARFQEAREEIVRSFASREVRPCVHCGHSYPGRSLELQEELDRILSLAGAQGTLSGEIQAIAAPHIDLKAGQMSYALAYSMLKPADPTRIILLGVGHHLAEHLFSVTAKHFQTPLGLARADVMAVKNLLARHASCIAPDDFEHCSEHSLEFQVLFIQHCLEQDVCLVPILCGSLQAALPEYSRQAFLDRAGGMLEDLRSLIMDQEHRTMVVAGVDLSHIGPKFGHASPASALKTEAERHEQALLEALCARDPDAFWRESAAVHDEYNVCGFPALATLLEVLPPGRGRVLDHRLWMEDATRSGVGFGAVLFTA